MTRVFHRNPRERYPVAVRGEGAYLIDRDGKRYLDASGGAALSNEVPAMGAAIPPFFVQAWLIDPTAPTGASASEALHASPP